MNVTANHLTRIQTEHDAEVERLTAERDAALELATVTDRTVQAMIEERDRRAAVVLRLLPEDR